jgi:hypothetical protein
MMKDTVCVQTFRSQVRQRFSCVRDECQNILSSLASAFTLHACLAVIGFGPPAQAVGAWTRQESAFLLTLRVAVTTDDPLSTIWNQTEL